MKLRALSDRIIVKKIDLEVKTASGLYLGEIEKDREVAYAKVLFVGPGRDNPVNVEIGEVVAIRENLPVRANYRGEFVWICREADILFVVEDTDISEKDYVLEGYELDKQVTHI